MLGRPPNTEDKLRRARAARALHDSSRSPGLGRSLHLAPGPTALRQLDPFVRSPTRCASDSRAVSPPCSSFRGPPALAERTRHRPAGTQVRRCEGSQGRPENPKWVGSDSWGWPVDRARGAEALLIPTPRASSTRGRSTGRLR